jgi:preprotein translocase subunit SecG
MSVFIFLIVLIAILALLLTLLVLLQSGKGGGLAGIAAGGATTQILGSRQAPDILEKATWTLGSLFIVLCILTNFAIGPETTNESIIQQQAQGIPTQQAPVLPPATDQPAEDTPPAPVEDGGNQ